MLPRKILKIEAVKYAFFNVLVNDSAHLLQEKIGQKYRQSFLCSEENDRTMSCPSIYRFFVWKTACRGRVHEKGQKTQKNFEFRMKNK